LGGVAGYKLQVAPGKKALELLKDQEVKTSLPFDWQSGAWTQLRVLIRKVKAGEWKIEGKAWPQGSAEPKEWMVAVDEAEEPVGGRASVLGSPFAGTPIWFDDLRVERVGEK
jgi:L-fucose isomerase-like protein